MTLKERLTYTLKHGRDVYRDPPSMTFWLFWFGIWALCVVNVINQMAKVASP